MRLPRGLGLWQSRKRPRRAQCSATMAKSACAAAVFLAFATLTAISDARSLPMTFRSSALSAVGRSEWIVDSEVATVDLERVGFIVVDMWDKHWCASATTRVAELAGPMNEYVKAARAGGAQIIWAPSDVFSAYDNTTQRRWVLGLPDVELPPGEPGNVPPMPLGTSHNQGCDVSSSPGTPWTRQIATLELEEGDGMISSHDGAAQQELWNVVQAKNLTSLIYMGVHENMCIMGRPFAIETTSAWGTFERISVVRELVDVMYTPADVPYVPHAEGIELQTAYIEKFWGHSVSMYDVLDRTDELAPAASAAKGAQPATEPGPLAPRNPDYRWASAEAVEAWRDLKFGLRIHWGLYAQDAIGPESWPLNRNSANTSFLKWYWGQASSFRPAAFDADSWIAMMKSAGIRFFDFTTKHHEGFSMYATDTRVHDCWAFDDAGGFEGIAPCAADDGGIAFSSVESAGVDFTAELVAAARKQGIAPGLYFSHIDWFDADMRIDEWNPVATSHCAGEPCDPKAYTNSTRQWERFVLRHRAQTLEILTKYGPILELSFDMHFPKSFDEDMLETVRLARDLAPNTLFRGRGMGGHKGDCEEMKQACPLGDYFTPEEVFPDSTLPGNWQVIFHGSQFMSFDPDASHYVNGSFIIWHLVDIVSKGGLMQIGYGPDRDGVFHPKAVEALEYAGRWLSTNGEAIFATRSMPVRWNDTAASMVRYTRSKDGEAIYATVLSGFGSSPLENATSLSLQCVSLAPKASVTILGYLADDTRQPIPLTWRNSASSGGVEITLPSDLDRYDAIVDPGFVVKMTSAEPRSCTL